MTANGGAGSCDPYIVTTLTAAVRRHESIMKKL